MPEYIVFNIFLFFCLFRTGKKNLSRKENGIEHLTSHIKSGNDDYMYYCLNKSSIDHEIVSLS